MCLDLSNAADGAAAWLGGSGIPRLDPAIHGGHIARMIRKEKKTPAAANCPICGEPTEDQWRPFCSRRCADIDLGRWMTGSYAIPSEEDPGPEASVDPDEEERRR